MEQFDLDTPLLELAAESARGAWTIRNAVEGVQIFGGIGSGKTSGSGRTLALKYLQAGFGGLVLTVKPDEKDAWVKYCKQAGRSNDLLIVEPKGEHYFNFLEYESRSTDDLGMTENIVQVLKTAINAGDTKGGFGGNDPFWENALDMLIFNVIDLCQLAYGKVTVQLLYDIVEALPKPEKNDNSTDNAFYKAFQAARENVRAKVKEWEDKQGPDALQALKGADYDTVMYDQVPEARILKLVDQFLADSYLNLSDKTRSVIHFSFSGFLFRLLRDPVYKYFCGRSSTFLPEDSLAGKIIVLNFPVKLYQKIGKDIQILVKYIWQRRMEKRDTGVNKRPVFLWADEAQNFLHPHDAEYQATARSSLISTVYLTQNLPNYLASMGGAKSDAQVKGFLGTLATKIFHANADIETNRYASDLIGDGYFEDTSQTATAAGQYSSSKTRSLKIDKIVRPEEFALLKTGGDKNGNKVEGYIHLQGLTMSNSRNYLKASFNQENKRFT